MTEQQLMAWAVAEMLAGRLWRSRLGDGTLRWHPPEPIAVHRGVYRALHIRSCADLEAAAAGNYELWHTRVRHSLGAPADQFVRQLSAQLPFP